MNGLIIDTTADELAVVLINGGNITSYVGGAEERRHSRTVLKAVDGLLAAAGLKPSDFDAVGAVAGPGSFTGIRIGVATANAIAAATGAKRVQMTSLEVLAEGEGQTLAALSCGHGEFYALKRIEGKEDEYSVITETELAASAVSAVHYSSPDPKKLSACFLRKFGATEFSPTIKSFYIKVSSAEK